MFQLFELLTIFDWITPAKGTIEDLINDPTPLQSNSWTFFVPHRDSPLGARQIEAVMRANGIHTWGSQITGGEFFFSVPLAQAAHAEYILNSNSVPIWAGSQGVPSVALDNSFQTATLTIVPAPSVWGLLKRLLGQPAGANR